MTKQSKSLPIGRPPWWVGGAAVVVILLIVRMFWIVGPLHGEPPAPPKPVEAARVEQTYQVGKTYRSLVKFELRSPISQTDWGVSVHSMLTYSGELLVFRTIEANDGQRLTVRQEFRRAQSIRVATSIKNIEFVDIGLPGELVIGAVDWYGRAQFGLPGQWTDVVRTTAGEIVDHPVAKELLSRAATDQYAKVMAYVDDLQGKVVRFTYVNGKGVERPIELVRDNAQGQGLSQDQGDLIATSAVLSDMYLVPNPDCKVGDSWKIESRHVMPLIDPSLHAVLEGELTARREADEGSGDDRQAVVRLRAGSGLQLRGYDEERAYLGNWNPQGEMRFSFKDGIVKSAKLSGTIDVRTETKNHWVFKATFTAQPVYTVSYDCEIVP